MFTVALIGADGAGKTTIANRLLETFPLSIKYIYMGMNVQSGNIALPTSRLVFFLKLYKYRRSQEREGKPSPEFVSLHLMEHQHNNRGKIWAFARLVNRLAEGAYRHFVAWTYQLRNYIVLYDRHFLFDSSPKTDEVSLQNQRLTNRIYLWFLNHVYPQPDLVIFLDAPPEVLYARKQEVPLDYLQNRREAYLEKGKTAPNFIRVDANHPIDKVYEDVSQHIIQFYSSKNLKRVHSNI